MPATSSRIDDKLVDRQFHDDDVRALADAMTLDQLFSVLGAADEEHVRYAMAGGWQVGDERPSLAHDDPAVMQAVGRCATNRIRLDGAPRLPGDIHPSTCDWCDFPLEELLKACAWSVHQSGYVEAHVFVWLSKAKDGTKDPKGPKYVRAGGDTAYRHREHRAFWDLPPKERERRIEAATGRAERIATLESTDGK